VSGFVRNVLVGAVLAVAAGGAADLRAQTQLADPKDAPRIFASTCSACHKSPQGLAKSGQVAGFLRQHYTTGPEMSAAMAAYLVAAGSAPAAKKGQAEAKAGQAGDNPAAKAKKKQEQAAAQAGQTPAERAADAKERRTLRGKQQAKEKQEERVAAHPSPASAAEAATHQTPAAPIPALAETHAASAAPAPPEPAPPLVVLDIPLPEMPTAPPPDLSQSAFSTSPLP
jgi:hypothetical protein